MKIIHSLDKNKTVKRKKKIQFNTNKITPNFLAPMNK